MEYLFEYLMYEHESIVLSAIIILLTVIILLLLYLLTGKICLWELTKIIQAFARQNNSSISHKTVKSYETPLSVER